MTFASLTVVRLNPASSAFASDCECDVIARHLHEVLALATLSLSSQCSLHSEPAVGHELRRTCEATGASGRGGHGDRQAGVFERGHDVSDALPSPSCLTGRVTYSELGV